MLSKLHRPVMLILIVLFKSMESEVWNLSDAEFTDDFSEWHLIVVDDEDSRLAPESLVESLMKSLRYISYLKA